MKKMLSTAVVLFMAQFSMAAVGLSPKEAMTIRVNRYTENIEAARLASRNSDFKDNEIVRKAVSKSLEKVISESKSSATPENLMKLLNHGNSRVVLTEIGRLSLIISEKKSTAAEVNAAKKALDLLSLSANSVELLSNSEAHAKQQQAKIEMAVKISEKIAKFNDYTSQTAKTYAKAYETALESGMDPKAAMKEASRISNKEIKEDDLLNCIT